MITANHISEILSLYAKHDWILRRVLLTDKVKSRLSEGLKVLFRDCDVISSDIDAAWFSRRSARDREAWELRLFGENPFALLETFGDSDSAEHKEEVRSNLQTRIAKFSSKKRVE